jgi:phospholipid-binding lipoprotein MlaA
MKTPEVLQRLFSKAERSAAVLAVVLFAAVAALPVRAEGHALGQEQFQPDPLEPLNRATHRFNSWAEEKIFEPLFNRYETQLTPTTRERLHNIFRNLQEPVIAVTSGLAGDLDNATIAGLRFGINSTVGLLGSEDVAGELLLESRPTDLSYTLCRYGVPNGPYLVFPLVGGVSARNLSGRSATQVAGIGLLGPLFAPLYPLPQMTGYAQSRQVLDFILDDALDPYARERAVVRQREALACGEDPTESLLYKQLGTNELQEAQRYAGSRQAVDQLP